MLAVASAATWMLNSFGAGIFDLYTPPVLYLASLFKLKSMFVTLSNFEKRKGSAPVADY